MTKTNEALSTRVPRRRYFSQPHNSLLGALPGLAASQGKMLDEQGWTGRRVLGFKLPAWQRPFVWDDEQARRFIQSIYLGVSLGTYMVNLTLNNPKADLVLLDGQQRLHAIERYLAGDLAVEGEDGVAYRWTDLTPEEQAHFNRMPFPWYESAFVSDADLRAAYNRHNFGGTAHQEHQRA